MPKIQVTFKKTLYDVTISGESIEEIEAQYKKIEHHLDTKVLTSHPRKIPESGTRGPRSASGSIPDRILELKSKGFFRESRTIKEVKEALATKGVTKKLSSISGPLQGLVRNDELRRNKKKGDGRTVWVYRV